MNRLGLYLHIPFCRSKCRYCDFCSFTGCSAEMTERYVGRLCDDLRTAAPTCRTHTVDSVFFGGGTPTVLSAEQLTRIAETVSIRSYEKLEKGENPGIAQLENEANLDEKGRKKDKNFVEIKPKVTSEPIEYRIDNRWCKCYDVKLKSICAPAVALALYVSNEEKTLSRVDIILDDDSKESFIIDWREQDGIVLPRVIRRLEDNAVYFRNDAKVISKNRRIEEEAEAAQAAEEDTAAEATEQDESGEDEMVEIDASAGNGDFDFRED